MGSGIADEDVPFELLPGEEFHIPLALLHQSALTTGRLSHHTLVCLSFNRSIRFLILNTCSADAA